MQPVTILQVSLRMGSSLPLWHHLPNTGQAYSAVEKHKASADVRSVLGWAPHFELVSCRRRLFLVETLALVFRMCAS